MKKLLLGFLIIFMYSLCGFALANPEGAQIVNGDVQFNQNGKNLSITNTPGTIINWQKFNIDSGERTHFQQQNPNSAVLNRVIGNDLSKIYGTLSSNGKVFLINPNGILMGKGAMIDVPAFIASTQNLSNADFLANRFNFTANELKGKVINQGEITTPLGGRVWLIGDEVRNEGVITSPQGEVILAAGKSATFVDENNTELRVNLKADNSKAINLGKISAKGGTINIFAGLIENGGELNANSVDIDKSGRIYLKASKNIENSGVISANNLAGVGGKIVLEGEDILLKSNSNINADGGKGGGEVLIGGDWQGKNSKIYNAKTTTMEKSSVISASAIDSGEGGKVVLWSDGKTKFQGSIYARGGKYGGNGGNVETSGKQSLVFRGGQVDTSAPKEKFGHWLLDPDSYCLYDTNSSVCGSQTTWVSRDDVVFLLNSANNVTFLAGNVIDIFELVLSGSSFTGTTLTFQAPLIKMHLGGYIDASNKNLNINFFSENGTSHFGPNTYVKTGGNIVVSTKTLETEYNPAGTNTPGYTCNSFSNCDIVRFSSTKNSIYHKEAYDSTVLLSNNTITTYKPNYTGTQAPSTIAYKAFTINVAANNKTKTYDGNYYSDPFDSTVTGFVGSDTLSSTFTGNIAYDDLSSARNVGTYTIKPRSDSLTPISSNHRVYDIDYVYGVLTINKKSLTLNVNYINKIYDGTTSVSYGGGLSGGLLSTDTISGGTYTFTDKNAGSGKTVKYTGYTINDGNNGGNYDLSIIDNTNSVINKKELTLYVNDITKTYDGNTSATNGSLSGGLLSTDTITGGSYNFLDKNAGSGKTVKYTGYTINDGNNGGNYALTIRDSLSSVIEKRLISSLSGEKLFDSTNVINGSNLSADNKVLNDDLTFSGYATLSGIDIGEQKINNIDNLNLSGDDANNYQLNKVSLPNSKIKINQAVEVDPCANSVLCKGLATQTGGLNNNEGSYNGVDYSDLAESARKASEMRSKTASAFAAVAVGASKESLEQAQALRKEVKQESFKPALQILLREPSASDLPPCFGQDNSLCIPDPIQTHKIAELRRYRSLKALGKVDFNSEVESLPEFKQVSDLPAPAIPISAEIPQIGRKIAVVIGINNYQDKSIPQLQSAVFDAKTIADEIKSRFGYQVSLLTDGTREEIITNLNKLTQSVTADDSVIIYYAGHGFENDDGAGYWLPSDAESQNPKKWISNNDVIKIVNAIPANQITVISDSCYSGILAGKEKVQIIDGAKSNPSLLLPKRSVVVMSSGGEEPVSDEGLGGHSIFAYSLISALKNVEKAEVGTNLFDKIFKQVIKTYPQTPQYGALTSAGYQNGGDFIVEVRKY